jgi:photosystem II stability/assembly factor-like uncharacterized protein
MKPDLKKAFPLVIAALTMFAAPMLLYADWESLGPYGGHALKIVLDPKDPSHLFVATKNGQVYHSTNRGVRWTSLPFSVNANAALHAIAVHPETSDVLYLGVAENSAQPLNSGISGVFKSDDGGQTWTLLPATRDWPVLSLAIHPKQPQVIVAGTLQGVYRSENAGAEWKRISPLNHPDLKGVVSLALDPTNVQVIYAGTPHLPWRTQDGGASWTSIHQGMIDDSDMFSIAVDRTDPQRIFASACSGIYRSSSRGDLWSKMQGIPGTNRRTHIILQDPVDSKIIYAGTTQGLWKSPDGGSTWQKTNPYPYVINSIAIDPTDHKRLYLATDRSGILKSHDGGLTFQALNEGFINRNIGGFVSEDALYLSSLYDGDFGGIFSSADAGRSWKLNANQVALKGKNVIALAVSPVNSRLLLAGTYEGLLKSEDGGSSWRAVTGVQPRPAGAAKTSQKRAMGTTTAMRLPETKIFDVRFSAAAPNVVYAATAQGLFESADNAVTWKRSQGPVSSVAVYKVWLHSTDPNWIIAQSSNHFYVSGDRGRSWNETSLGNKSTRVNDLAFGNVQGRIFAGTSHGLFESLDGGKSWSPAAGGLPMIPVNQFCVSRKQSSLMYFLSHADNQVYRSTDGGERWTRFDDGGLKGLSIQSLASSASQMDDLFVLTENQGVLIYRPSLASASSTGFAAKTSR